MIFTMKMRIFIFLQCRQTLDYLILARQFFLLLLIMMFVIGFL